MPANNPHQPLLEAQLPYWARQAAPDQWAALKQTQTAPWQTQDWFANAAPDLRQAVHASQARLIHSQAALARALKGLNRSPSSQNHCCRAVLQHKIFMRRCAPPSCCGSNVTGTGLACVICTAIVATTCYRPPCRTSPTMRSSLPKVP